MKIRFTPSLQADTAILSVLQRDQTTTWQSEPPEPTATVTVQAIRSPLQTAPERVFFELSMDGFGVEGPTTSDYDPQKHDLIYMWDFADSGSVFSAPIKTLSDWRNSNIGYGPFVAHVFQKPGDYEISVLVVEPETGKTATASFSITVADPDLTFPSRNTIYVSQNQNFDNAPPGAVLKDDLVGALQQAAESSNPRRVMLRRGERWTWDHAWVTNLSPSLHIVAEPGNGARPILEDSPSRTRDPFFTHRNTLPDSEFLYHGISFVGAWDSTKESGYPNNIALLIETGAQGAVIVDDCFISGFSSAISEQNNSIMPIEEQDGKSLLVHNTHITNWRAIGHFAVGATLYGFLGCTYACDPDALAGGPKDGFHNEHGCIRFQPKFPHKAVIDGCDFFNRVGWAENVAEIRTQQPCIRWNQNSVSNALLNMQRCSLEGGYSIISLNGVNGDTSEGIQNILIDRCVFVGSHMTRSMISMDTTGITIRNCLAIFPDVPRLHGIFEALGFVEAGNNFNAASLAATIRIYQNTILNFMSDGNSPRADGSVQIVIDQMGPAELVVENNLIHQPNLTVPDIDHAPLSDDILWVPRERGYKSDTQENLLSQHATPFDAVQLPHPREGSSAIGAALSGLVGYYDLHGKERPLYPARGALEMR